MRDTLLVTISILGYNEKPEVIGAAIRSAALQRYEGLEIIVGDNAYSEENTRTAKNLLEEAVRERREKLGLPVESRFVANGENLNFARGHNKNMRLAKGEFILLLNSDAILDERFVEIAIKKFTEDPHLAALQGKLVRYDFSKNAPAVKIADGAPHPIIDTTGLLMLKNRRIVNRGQGEPDQGQFEKEEEIFGADGAAPIYRKAALEDTRICLDGACEYLDEDFFFYKEDVDLAWRLRLYGWKTLYIPSMWAWHGRTAGESAATNYRAIIKERRRIAELPKLYSFKNQRLMQVKNELLSLLVRHLPGMLIKEVGAWGYLAIFERNTLKAVHMLLRQLPRALQKRRLIMAHRRVGAEEMARWFQ